MFLSKQNTIVLTILISLLVVDIPVLTLLKPLWDKTVFGVQHKSLEPNKSYAFITYILLTYGLYNYVYKNIDKKNWKHDTLIKGFIFGVIVYGVFDFTNLAIFSNYPFRTAIIDTLWGGLLMALTTNFVYYLFEIKKIIN